MNEKEFDAAAQICDLALKLWHVLNASGNNQPRMPADCVRQAINLLNTAHSQLTERNILKTTNKTK
jgi:hypothetical protein